MLGSMSEGKETASPAYHGPIDDLSLSEDVDTDSQPSASISDRAGTSQDAWPDMEDSRFQIQDYKDILFSNDKPWSLSYIGTYLA